MNSRSTTFVTACLAALLPPPLVVQASATAEGAFAEAPEAFDRLVGWISLGIEAAGIGVIVVGGLLATAMFLRRAFGRDGFARAYRGYRSHLGRAILLGLEFLVAADIIGTVAVDPTFQNLGVLGLIVLIRTFLSFSLEVEINGRWPWQGGEAEGRAGDENAL